jgi:hypothetical protein
MAARPMQTLAGRDYHAPQVFDPSDSLLDEFNARYLGERGPVD